MSRSRSAEAKIDAAMKAVASSTTWPSRRSEVGIDVATGFIRGVRAYRTTVELAAPVDVVAEFFTSASVEHLPTWSAEFESGECVAELSHDGGLAGWRFRVVYATPPPLANRFYDYEVWWRRVGDVYEVAYDSVDETRPPRGAVTATLDATGYRLTPRSDGGTRVEHVLVTDLGGRIPRWVQDRLLIGSMLQAQLRDARAQRLVLRDDATRSAS